NIVFRLARDCTGLAADAGIQIDRHAPGILLVILFGISIVLVKSLIAVGIASGFYFTLMGELRVLTVLRQCSHLHRIAILHGEMALGNGHLPIFFRRFYLDAPAKVLRGAGTHRIRVVSRALADTS